MKFRKQSVRDQWDVLVTCQDSSLAGYLSAGKREEFVKRVALIDFAGRFL